MEDKAIERANSHSTRNIDRYEEIPVHTQRRRRPGRKPKRILALWARVTLLGLTVCVMALAVIGLVTKAIRPYRETSLQTRELADTRQQVNSLDSQNESLRQRIAYLKTSDGVVVEARKMGYFKTGEIPFVVEGQSHFDETPQLSRVGQALPNDLPSRTKRLRHRQKSH